MLLCSRMIFSPWNSWIWGSLLVLHRPIETAAFIRTYTQKHKITLIDETVIHRTKFDSGISGPNFRARLTPYSLRRLGVLNLSGPRRIEWKAKIVVWVMTVAVFLVTFATGVVLLFLFSQRGVLREPKQKRTEGRIRFRVEVAIISTDEPFIQEITVTENVSRYGARVVTKRWWRPNAGVTVKLLVEDLPYSARIAYCHPLRDDAFAVGMQFPLPVVSWMVRPIS